MTEQFEEGEPYKIDWLDSGMQLDLGWKTIDEHLAGWQLNDMRVTTIGLFVYEDEDVVGLALSQCGEAIFGLQLIVKNNIITSQRLELPDAE